MPWTICFSNLVRMRTEQVLEAAGQRFSLHAGRVEMAWNQWLVTAHANWHECCDS